MIHFAAGSQLNLRNIVAQGFASPFAPAAQQLTTQTIGQAAWPSFTAEPGASESPPAVPHARAACQCVLQHCLCASSSILDPSSLLCAAQASGALISRCIHCSQTAGAAPVSPCPSLLRLPASCCSVMVQNRGMWSCFYPVSVATLHVTCSHMVDRAQLDAIADPPRSTFATSTFVLIRAALGSDSTRLLGPSTVYISVRTL